MHPFWLAVILAATWVVAALVLALAVWLLERLSAWVLGDGSDDGGVR